MQAFWGVSARPGSTPRVSAVTVLVGIVLLLVPALAYMQYQWLGQLSQAEQERMQRTLRTAASQFATEFDTGLSRALVSLQVDGPTLREQNWTAYAQRYSAWATSASEPRLVRDVLLVDTLPGTPLPQPGADSSIPIDRLRLRKWNTQTLAFEAAEWTGDLSAMRASLATHFIGFQVERGRLGGSAAARMATSDRIRHDTTLTLSPGDDSTLISPVTLFELMDDRRGPPKVTVLGFTVVRLNPAIVRDTLLASLARRHFHGGDDEIDYRIAVVSRDDQATVIWESEPGVAALIAPSPDVTANFMGPRPEQMFIFARGATALTPGAPAAVETQPGEPAGKIVVSMVQRGERGGPPRGMARAGQFNPFDGRWVLMAKHRSGSLQAAVAAVRQRNLMISSTVLLLLTMAIGLIVVSARRAQALARQQMEFVAAVSHELRTPVSVIGAAAGNLADGVVEDPQRVRKYGATIQGEARRLAETVERVLQLAGIAAGRAAASQSRVSPDQLVQDSVAACRTEIEAAGVRVEIDVADNLPEVLGDITALRSALQNLISNAVKYGGDAHWLRVSASAPSSGGGQARPAVTFRVEDHGIGIAPDERKHIFEPFYRGRDAVSQQIHGSGLGLNLVQRIAEAHGGTVTVTSEPGKGSTFSLSLPAAPARPIEEAGTAFAPGLASRS